LKILKKIADWFTVKIALIGTQSSYADWIDQHLG